MLRWIKRAIASGNTARTGGIRELLSRDVSGLQGAASDLKKKAVAYVLEDVGGDVPSLIRQALQQQRSYPVGADRWARELRPVRWELYDRWDELDAGFWTRFGAVLAAAATNPFTNAPALTLGATAPWLEALALDLTGTSTMRFGVSEEQKVHPIASMSRLEALLEAAGKQRSELVISAFRSGPKRPSHNRWGRTGEFVALIPGFEESTLRHADPVRGAFADTSFENRLHALALVKCFSVPGLQTFAAELVALVLDSSAQVRAAAIPVALRAGLAVLEIARARALDDAPPQRAQALQLLWASGDPAAREFVKQRGVEDPAETVRQIVDGLHRSPALVETPLVAPPEPSLDFESPLGAEARTALEEIFRQYNLRVHEQRERMEARYRTNWKELSPRAVEVILGQVATHPQNGKLEQFPCMPWVFEKLMPVTVKWARREDVTLPQLFRLLVSCQWIRKDNRKYSPYGMWGPATSMLRARGSRPGGASLREIEKLLTAYGFQSDAIIGDWFQRWGGRFTDGWPDEAIWPYFAARLDVIREALDPSSALRKEYSTGQERVYAALAAFPSIPPDLVPMIFELALGGTQIDRSGAQRVLGKHPEIAAQVIPALSDRKTEVRATAASWLARLKATDAVGPLEAALRKEKNAFAAGAMLLALEDLGADLAQFLDRTSLKQEAELGLKKGIPADLLWFPFEGLPNLAWADTGQPVSSEVIRWWILQGFKLKSPEPGPVLRRHLRALRPADREALALYVLRAWLQDDVKPISRADAEQQARAQARQLHQSIKAHPKYFSETDRSASEEDLYQRFLPTWLQRPAGSATASKGILSLVAAGGGSEVAPLVQRYLKEWYGTRAQQGKALIQMLGWIEHPSATQLMLAVGNRFRTKSFQDEATRQAQLLAERRGWSVEELADRTIPTAGFDERGVAEIDYGERRFTARLGPDLDVQLYSPEEKPISSLPDPRADEDAAKVKEAKKSWAAARKELKTVLQLQKDRLYEALCTDRSWRFEDWDVYLHRHPIVRHYCQRLVWVGTGPDGARRTFRPLGDGSLTSVEDEAVTLDASARVSLAHSSSLPEDEGGAWQQHLSDYKIEPLFAQFGRGIYRLPESLKDFSEIEEFRGHVLSAFSLRGRAGKLGYTRGAAEDGGWFYVYEKRFPTLGLEARIEFTGNGLPEENRNVALLALSFLRRAGERRESTTITLGEVPTVLLSECWNDLRMLAAEGTGFDPEWEKKTGL